MILNLIQPFGRMALAEEQVMIDKIKIETETISILTCIILPTYS